MAAQTTIVSLSGRGTNAKTTLFVGGLHEDVTPEILRAAFLPFGEIKDISVPLDHTTGKHRGFGFVQYEEASDAADAVDNMNDGELYGRVLHVNLSANSKIKGGDKGWASQAVWADSDDWLKQAEREQAMDEGAKHE